MSLSLAEFQKRLIDSGLMSADELRTFLESSPSDLQPADGDQLARNLVKQRRLTKFQAEQIYAARGASLTLGNYLVLDKLGQGGMGMVLKAEHKRMKRVVAIKVMSPQAVKTPDALKRFHREVEAAAKLTHPNIVAAFDADEAKGTHFLVMEYVEGTDLSALVKKNGPLTVEKSVQCVIQAAQGLTFAHEQGVIHRDIKPANLLIDAKGTVKILDMGLARIEGDTGAQAELTNTGAVMGTVDYMAPEQARNTKTADARSDIYSLGISLWYLLVGRAAYDGQTLTERLLAHQSDPIPSLRAARSDVPASLDAVFQKMVAKKPADRYQSMNDVIADLQRCLVGESPTMSLGQASNTSTPATSNSASSTGNELNDFLRQINSGEPTLATKLDPRAMSSRPTTDAPTLVSNGGQAGTDPLTEQFSQRDRSRRSAAQARGLNKQTRTLTFIGAGSLALCLILGTAFVLTRKPGDTKQTTAKSKGAESKTKTSLSQSDSKATDSSKGWKPSREQQAFIDSVSKLNAEDQVTAVEAKLKELNPQFNIPARHKIEAGRVVMLTLSAPQLEEIWPVRALTHLEQFSCGGNGFYSGNVRDLSPLAGMKIKWLILTSGKVSDLRPLKGMPLERLEIIQTHVTDLSPLADLPLKVLRIHETKIEDFEPLRKTPLEEFYFDFDTDRSSDLEFINSMPKLTRINGKSRADFLADVPAEREVAAVIARLRTLNPNFDGKNTHRVIDQKIRELRFYADHVTDISPVAELKDLTLFACTGKTSRSGKLWDISPLKGLKLEHVDLLATQVADLSPLRDLPLYELRIGITPVTDLSPLKGRGLSILEARETEISDISPLMECKGLRSLTLTKTKVSADDIAALQKALPNCKIQWDGSSSTPSGDPNASSNVSSTSPPSDYSLSFDGTGSVVIDSPPDCSPTSTTIEAYVRVDASVPRGSIYQLGGNQGLGLDFETGTHWRLSRILNPNGHFSAESTTNVELGRRVHVAGVCGADKFQVYVDGKLVATSGNARNRDFKPGTAPHRIGAMFKGVIDEVRISKTPRYDKDFTPAPRLLTDQNTLALYLFDEGTGDLVKDSSGNNHHGKIVGAKWVKDSSSPGDASTSEQTSSWELSGRVFLPQLKLDFTKPLTIEAFATPSEASRHHHLFSSGPPEFSLRFVRGGEWEFLGLSTMKLKSQPQSFPRRMHVAAVLDNRQARLYVDGRKVQDATCDASKLAGLNQLHPQLGQDYVGTFDEVRISQISRYDQDFIPQIRFTPDANTVALYHCDEGSGKVLKDSSGNNHHGQIAVAQWVKISGSAAQSPNVETAANQTHASDEWIDVIPLIDPAQDKVDLHNLTGKNDWRLDNGELKFVGDGKPGKLLFPIKYRQANLEWEIEFTRTSGSASFNSDVPATGGAVPIMVDERSAGAVLLGVKSMRLPGAAKIETGKRSKVLFRITRQNNQDALQVVFNNQPAGEWTGERQTLVKPTNEGYNTAERNGIWIHGGSDYTFHRIRIRAPGGSVSPIRPQNGGLVDLLKTINTGRDADPGTKSNWKLEKGTLVGSGGRVFLPVESIPEEYDLKLRVERKSAGNALVLGLVSGGRRVGLILDGFQSRGGLSGLENIDGKGPLDNGTGVKDKPFSVNQSYDLVVQVRKTGIRVERDGQTFLDWKGNPSQLSLGSTWNDNGPPRLFLGAQAQFEIQRLEFEAK